jgi:hypothetical protein
MKFNSKREIEIYVLGLSKKKLRQKLVSVLWKNIKQEARLYREKLAKIENERALEKQEEMQKEYEREFQKKMEPFVVNNYKARLTLYPDKTAEEAWYASGMDKYFGPYKIEQVNWNDLDEVQKLAYISIKADAATNFFDNEQ